MRESPSEAVFSKNSLLYRAYATTRKSSGEMIRKLSVIRSRKRSHFFGNSSPKEAQDCRSELGEGFIASITRRLKSLEVLIPILYIKGISTGDFEEALVALLGKDAVGNAAECLALSNVAVVGGWTP
jgi:hypothetical protein